MYNIKDEYDKIKLFFDCFHKVSQISKPVKLNKGEKIVGRVQYRFTIFIHKLIYFIKNFIVNRGFVHITIENKL